MAAGTRVISGEDRDPHHRRSTTAVRRNDQDFELLQDGFT
jgi:hypothetical protein